MDEPNDKITESVRNGLEEVCPKIEPVKKKEPWEEDRTMGRQTTTATGERIEK